MVLSTDAQASAAFASRAFRSMYAIDLRSRSPNGSLTRVFPLMSVDSKRFLETCRDIRRCDWTHPDEGRQLPFDCFDLFPTVPQDGFGLLYLFGPEKVACVAAHQPIGEQYRRIYLFVFS
jgi:hypothetical protein